ncbi:MAG: class SAM-dependent methyltransferase [Chloroflexi bacterium]|nr:class SAM-dependent methyltransferase [Chloroflexota bacterium]
MQERWLFDELMHAGDEHLDPQYVAGYDHKAGVDPALDLALLRDLALAEASTVVDLGAGTGTFALAAAPLCRRVVAVDVSPAMLTLLRARAEQQGLTNVEIVHAGFLTYEHGGEPADFVYSRHALHHLPDFWKAVALHRIAAFLKPGGVLRLRDLIFSCDPPEVERVIEAWLGGAAQRAEEGWTRRELKTHLGTEYSTFSWLLEDMLDRAGFVVQHVEHDESMIYSAYTCVKR